MIYYPRVYTRGLFYVGFHKLEFLYNLFAFEKTGKTLLFVHFLSRNKKRTKEMRTLLSFM